MNYVQSDMTETLHQVREYWSKMRKLKSGMMIYLNWLKEQDMKLR